MTTSFIKRCYRLDRAEIAYLRFILEGYDGLVFMRTLEPRSALVEISFSADCRRDAEALLAALSVECGMTEEPLPSSGEYSPL